MNYLKSRTNWAIFLMFVVAGVSGVKDVIPAVYLPYIEGVLALAGIYSRSHPVQEF